MFNYLIDYCIFWLGILWFAQFVTLALNSHQYTWLDFIWNSVIVTCHEQSTHLLFYHVHDRQCRNSSCIQKDAKWADIYFHRVNLNVEVFCLHEAFDANLRMDEAKLTCSDLNLEIYFEETLFQNCNTLQQLRLMNEKVVLFISMGVKIPEALSLDSGIYKWLDSRIVHKSETIIEGI